MHHIYHTEGIILGNRNFSEDGKYYYIFTRELGMLCARASGVRKMSSKLRYILQDFSYLNFDLVRGRDFWRLTSASKIGELENLPKSFEKFRIISNIARLLRRRLAGEEANQKFFDDLVSGLRGLESAKSGSEINNTEVVIVLQALAHLGYVGSDKVSDLISQVELRKIEILSLINQTLRETHL